MIFAPLTFPLPPRARPCRPSRSSGLFGCGCAALCPLPRRLRVISLSFALTSFALLGAEAPASRFESVEVASTWTSIYIGTVSLKLPRFVRNANGEYECTYAARVLPYFFYNENGRLTVRVSDADLQKLARGEVIEFTGRAVNQAGEERRVEGKATPTGATSGKLKVKVRVSPRIELIFNTTYRFPP